MSSATPRTRGEELERRLYDGIRRMENAPHEGARALAVLTGINDNGSVHGLHENKLVEARNVLVATRRVYRQSTNVVLEKSDGANGSLVDLTIGGSALKNANARLANVVLSERRSQDGQISQAPLPAKFVEAMFASDPLLDALPEIVSYSRRPIFDQNFDLCGPGYNATAKTLVHADAAQPSFDGRPDATLPPLERLPPHLRTLLWDFPFRSPADLANAVGCLVTGVLANRFVANPKPLFMIDGNQPNVGKTLFARSVGVVIDGIDPQLIKYTPNDEELEKRVGAAVIETRSSVIVFDNAKVRDSGVINSPTIEVNSVAPQVSFRILGQSKNFSLPNDFLWFITMNDSRVCPDIASRNVPIRLYYEGDPNVLGRFEGRDPIRHAFQHRYEILNEIIGMVIRWTQEGRPRSSKQHRCRHWAEDVGGILEVAGFTEFLDNVDEADAEFNVAHEGLSALAEASVQAGQGHWVEIGAAAASPPPCGSSSRGRTATDWKSIFLRTHVLKAELEASGSDRSKTTRIGKYFAQYLGRSVSILVRERSGTATLRKEEASGNRHLYYFEVAWADSAPSAPSPVQNGPQATDTLAPTGNVVQELPDTTTCSADAPPNETRAAPPRDANDGNDEDW